MMRESKFQKEDSRNLEVSICWKPIPTRTFTKAVRIFMSGWSAPDAGGLPSELKLSGFTVTCLPEVRSAYVSSDWGFTRPCENLLPCLIIKYLDSTCSTYLDFFRSVSCCGVSLLRLLSCSWMSSAVMFCGSKVGLESAFPADCRTISFLLRAAGRLFWTNSAPNLSITACFGAGFPPKNWRI